MKNLFSFFLIFASSSPVFTQDIIPQQNGDLYSLEFENIYFEVDASFGGHISAFEIDGINILYPSQNAADYLWGSTLWPSPQSVWGWPPSTILDSEAYVAEIAGNKIRMISAKDNSSKLVFEKIFYANPADTSVTIDYIIKNEGTSNYQVAAWEVSRVYSGGLTFFPMGEGNVTGSFAGQTIEMNEIIWYEHESNDPAANKFFSDGADGWLAHITENNVLFIKQWEDVAYTGKAPGEAEIELWYQGNDSYIELENQSSYESIPVGGSLNYSLKWFLRELPGSSDISVGNMDLVGRVEKIINKVAIGTKTFEKSDFRIYPNPATTHLKIFSEANNSFSISLFDITGKEVICKENLMSVSSIDIQGLEAGLYFYRIKGKGNTSSGKLLKK